MHAKEEGSNARATQHMNTRRKAQDHVPDSGLPQEIGYLLVPGLGPQFGFL